MLVFTPYTELEAPVVSLHKTQVHASGKKDTGPHHRDKVTEVKAFKILKTAQEKARSKGREGGWRERRRRGGIVPLKYNVHGHLVSERD